MLFYGNMFIDYFTSSGSWNCFYNSCRVYTDEDLNPHNHLWWLYVLIHLSATFPLNDINSTPKACGFKSSNV